MLSEQRVAQILALMSKSENTGLTEAVAREVSLRAGGSTVVDGAIAQLGTEYVLTVKAVSCAESEARAAVQERASDKTHVLDALGRVATLIRQKLGEPPASVHRYDASPEDVTTPSLQALQLYSLDYASMIRQHD